MRPFQIILLSVFGVLALVGLFVFTTYSGFGGNKNAVGSLSIWGTLPSGSVHQALAALSAKSPEYKDVSYKQIPATQFDGQLADALASGSGPDMILISQEQLLTEVPRITAIPYKTFPQRTFVNTYVPEASLFLGSEGPYVIPYVIDPLVLYYNQSLLSSSGIAQPPSTWEAVNGLAQKLTHQTANQTITQSAVAFGGYGNVTNARAIISLLLLQAGNSITENSGGSFRSALSSTPAGTFGASPAESSVNFYTQFANPAKTTYSWNASLPSSQQAFLSGDLAFYIGFASERPFLADANPNLKFDMAPLPQPSSATTDISYGTIYGFAIPKASKNAANAYRTALALTDAQPLLTAAYALGMAPAKRALLTPSADDLYGPVYYPAALTATGWLSPTPATTDRIFASMIDAVVTGRSTTRDALRTAEQSLNAALH